MLLLQVLVLCSILFLNLGVSESSMKIWKNPFSSIIDLWVVNADW